MIQLFEGMVEAAKKDKKTFIALKNLAVKCQQFELASNLRDIEREIFPDTQEQVEAREIGKRITNAFSLVQLNPPQQHLSWLIYKTVEAVMNKKDEFSLKDAANLLVKRNQLFLIEDQ